MRTDLETLLLNTLNPVLLIMISTVVTFDPRFNSRFLIILLGSDQ